MSRRKHRPWKGRKVVITEPDSGNFGEQGIVIKADSDGTAYVKFNTGECSWYYYEEFKPVDGN